MESHVHVSSRAARSPIRLPLWLGLAALLAVAASLLWSGQRVHVLGALPFLPLLLCPAMHLFMHGGHGSHGTSGARDEARRSGDLT